MLGVRWYGEGLFVREEVFGHEVAAAKLHLVQSGDFVYNRLFAWKGSFAIAHNSHEGCYVSNEFPCFKVDANRLDVRFLLCWFRREASWTSALGLSSGATPTSRNRLKEAAFLSLAVPLPPLLEQQRIVARIDELQSCLVEAFDLRDEAAATATLVSENFRTVAFAKSPAGEVSDFVRFQTGYAFKSEWFTEEGIRLARGVNIGHGRLDWARPCAFLPNAGPSSKPSSCRPAISFLRSIVR